MTQDRFLHTLHFLHFADNSQRPDQDEEYNQLWKLGTVFYTLKNAYAKFYNPLENLEMDKGNKIQGQGYFQEVYSKEKKRKFIDCVMNQGIHMIQECTWVKTHSATDITATHATVTHMTCRVEDLGHTIFMDNLFSSPRLSDDLE
jgi:hypothetical protein